MWGSEFFFKRRCTTRGGDGGAHAIVRGGALVVRRRYFIVAPRPFPAVPLVVRRRCLIVVKSSQVITLPIAKSQTRSKQNKDMRKCSSGHSEPLPVLTSGEE